MEDWKSFRASYSITELFEPATLISRGGVDKLPIGFRSQFPKLSTLLSTARLTKLDTSYGIRNVFAWTRKDGTVCGWVCFEATQSGETPLHPDHRLLLQAFGAIHECWNEPLGLLNNLDSAFLPKTDKSHDGQCEEHGLSPREYVTFAPEANGNSHVYNVRSGEVYFLVSGIDGMLNLRIDGVSDFRAWVERVAQEWLDNLDGKQTDYPQYHR